MTKFVTMLKKYSMGKIVLLGVLLAGLSACAGQTTKPKTEAELKDAPGVLLEMMEREQGSETFAAKIYVNEGYLHMTDERSPLDYILFNRKEKTIYNVSNEEKTILVIRNKPVQIESPIALDYQEESQPSSAIPKINDREAIHYKFLANGKHCYDAVVMPKDFMPDVVEAMREFRLVLAGEHATTVDRTPKDLLDACDLSLNIFHSIRHMEHGLPIREWDRQGYQRFLKDYGTEVQAEKGTFDLPKDFKRYSIGDVLVETPDTAADTEKKPVGQ